MWIVPPSALTALIPQRGSVHGTCCAGYTNSMSVDASPVGPQPFSAGFSTE